MEIQVYSSEKFTKGSRRYIIFGTVCAGIIIISLLYRNIVGAILLFFILGAYFFFSVKNSQPVIMRITDTGLRVGDRVYPRGNIDGYKLDIDAQQDIVKNIVIVFANDHAIHTVDDRSDLVETFVTNLSNYIPLVQNFRETGMQRLARRLKL